MDRVSQARTGKAGKTLVAAVAAGACLVVGAACSDEVDPEAEAAYDEEQLDELAGLSRMGEIHVAVQPRPDGILAAPQLEIDARFVEFRDIPASDAASRAGVASLAGEVLRPGQCMSTRELSRFDGNKNQGAAPAQAMGDDPEVSLLDAGDVRVELGVQDYVVPVSLVPDLVPWVSGVEYAIADQDLPSGLLAPDGTVPAYLEVDGAPEAGLPNFALKLELPRPFTLIDDPDLSGDGTLRLAWEPSETGDQRMVLELQAYASGDATGEQVSCVVPDTGMAAMPLGTLELAGLGDGETVAVTARRVLTTYVDAGDFRQIRVVGEIRDRQLVAMPD